MATTAVAARSTIRLRRRLATIAPTISAKPNAASRPAIDARVSPGDLEVVVIVNVVSIVPAPGEADEGLNVQPVPVGRLLHARLTALENAPPCAASVTRYVAACPAETVTDPGEAVTPKFVTVTCIGVVSENETPLLLAPTLTLVVPNGHVIVEPGLEPHPPVHVSRVIGHWLGSLKPSCDGDRLAPPGVLPLTTSAGGPVSAGSAFFTDAKAFVRPDPNVLFGPPPISVAFDTIMLRSDVRADTGSAADVAPEIKHAAD
jgi:hypothetical protein